MASALDTRRSFLVKGTLLTAGAVTAPGLASALQEKKGEEVEVSPTEDLMREHGLLNRVLLIYDDLGRRLRSNTTFDPKVLAGAAGIIHNFIEQYHEKLEEDHLFPRLEKAGRLVDLVKTLRAQHAAGRVVTGRIEQMATAATLNDAKSRQQLEIQLAACVRMYRPHEAREDTILFPEIHWIVSKSEFEALGDDFEKKEHEMFGEEGFEGQVQRVGELEKSLGIYELAQFTPK